MKIKWETWPVEGEDWDCVSLDADVVGRIVEISNATKEGYMLRTFIGEGEVLRKMYKSLPAAKEFGERWMEKELQTIKNELRKLI